MESPDTGQLRALIVDDSRDSVYVLGKLMEKLGCDVTTCDAAEDCVDHAHRTQPHLILLDIAMPKKSGFTVAEDLLNARLPPFYLVAVSGFSGTKIEESCKVGGFHKHLLKPAGIEDLRQVIASAKQLSAEVQRC